MNILFACILAALVNIGGIYTIDRTVQDWGDVSTSDGPLECSFEIQNVSKEPFYITRVISSCGCTNVNWTRTEIAPGAKAFISAVYSNDQGPYPFDKSLTCYISTVKKPLILHLRGSVHEGTVTPEESFPYRTKANTSLGLKQNIFQAGNMNQGDAKSARFDVYNFGSTSQKVTIKSLHPMLSFTKTTLTIEPASSQTTAYTVNSSTDYWGKHRYEAQILQDGKVIDTICIEAATKEFFGDLSREQKKNGPKLVAATNTFSFDPVKKGAHVRAVFNYTTSEDFIFRAINIDYPDAKIVEQSPEKLVIDIDTSLMQKGEQTILVMLFTNSPMRPIINFFITGFIK